ncbi:MAG: helix-turn-helix domain-containing protein [Clostridia bacterium]|nr:helix-turn-helix domain-containing protein [Clostridia bacterium]
MPKIVVTDRLADTLKMLRMQNGIKSKDLAQHLGKTPGYVSKLEKGEVKNIDLEAVESIFLFLLGDDYKKSEIWEQIYASLQIKYSKGEMKKEIWFSNFDTVYRYIPIPDSLVDFINDKLTELTISRETLLSRINANDAISERERNDDSVELNKWYFSAETGRPSIKINMSLRELTSILEKEEPSYPYIYLLCIVYHLLKIEKFGNALNLGNHDIDQLNEEATNVLNSHKFYSIVERDALVSKAHSQEEIMSLLSSFDNQNAKLISNILEELKFASDIDVRMTNQRLEQFLKNLSENVWFTLKMISLDYHLLEPVDVEQRKAFIKEVEALIRKYIEAQKNIKNTETY